MSTNHLKVTSWTRWSRLQKGAALFCLLLLLAVAGWWVHDTNQPRYAGRKANQWLDLYLNSRNVVLTIPAPIIIRTNGGLRTVQPAAAQVRQEQLWNDQTSARQAIQAMGSNMVPFLIRKIRRQETSFDRWYQQNYGTTLQFFAEVLPRPRWPAQERLGLLALVANTGISTPELRQAFIDVMLDDNSNNISLFLNNFRAPPFEWNDFERVCDHLAAQKRYDDLLKWLPTSRFRNEKIQNYLFLAFDQPDPKIKFQALLQLERSDYDLRPIEAGLLNALVHEDNEMRYYAARTLVRVQPRSPEIHQAFEAALSDSNEMVRTVINRALGGVHQK